MFIEALEIPEFKFMEIEDGKLVETKLIRVSAPPVDIGELIMETLRKRIEALDDKVDDFHLNGFGKFILVI